MMRDKYKLDENFYMTVGCRIKRALVKKWQRWQKMYQWQIKEDERMYFLGSCFNYFCLIFHNRWSKKQITMEPVINNWMKLAKHVECVNDLFKRLSSPSNSLKETYFILFIIFLLIDGLLSLACNQSKTGFKLKIRQAWKVLLKYRPIAHWIRHEMKHPIYCLNACHWSYCEYTIWIFLLDVCHKMEDL